MDRTKHSVKNIMNDLTKAIFSEGMNGNVNIYHQHIQTAYVQIIASIIDPQNVTYDEASKAAALNTMKKLKVVVANAVSGNEETKAHRENLQFIINNALEKK